MEKKEKSVSVKEMGQEKRGKKKDNDWKVGASGVVTPKRGLRSDLKTSSVVPQLEGV